MQALNQLSQNHVLWAALIGWFSAQALKIPIYFFVEHKWDFSRFHGSGGMPSSHSAFIVATSLMIGTVQGFGTPIFALSSVVSMIVMYDASGVRRETGAQAVVINQIVKDAIFKGKPISDEELKELVGHTPLEVAGGALVGILVWFCYITFLLPPVV